MNKSDFKLTFILIIFTLSLFIILNLTKEKGDTALVYYEDKLIKKIDLNKDNLYSVQGYLGEVILEVKDKKIRIIKESSPNHICSKEGYIKDSSKNLICLPNKIIVKIRKDNKLDGVVY